MGAIIKASPALSSGSLVAVRQEINVGSSTEVTLDAEYVCLSTFADRWIAALRVGAPTPISPPSSLNYYNLISPLALNSVRHNVTQGLCYFSCSFSAPRNPTTEPDSGDSTQPQFETTTQSVVQQQQISGSYTTNASRLVRQSDGSFAIEDAEVSRPYTAIYYAETKTVTASSESLLAAEPSLFVGSLYISPLQFLQGRSTGTRVKPTTSYRTETSISSTGQRRYSVTGQIQYFVEQELD